MTAVYEAMLPRPKGADSEHPSGPKGNGQRAPIFEHPFPATDLLRRVTKGADNEHPNAGARACATSRTREPEPAPVGSRVEREHSLNSQAVTCREWMATPLTSLPSVPRTEVA